MEMLTTLDPMVTESNPLQEANAPPAMLVTVELNTMWPLQHAIDEVADGGQKRVLVNELVESMTVVEQDAATTALEDHFVTDLDSQ